jgi:hypothetical protein
LNLQRTRTIIRQISIIKKLKPVKYIDILRLTVASKHFAIVRR